MTARNATVRLRTGESRMLLPFVFPPQVNSSILRPVATTVDVTRPQLGHKLDSTAKRVLRALSHCPAEVHPAMWAEPLEG